MGKQIDFQTFKSQILDRNYNQPQSVPDKKPEALQVTDVFPLVSSESKGDDESIQIEEPYLNAQGDLVIPFNSDPKYHWWKGGQDSRVTRSELLK